MVRTHLNNLLIPLAKFFCSSIETSNQKLLVSLIQRGVIKQQTKGEPLVQAPSTFTNGIWDGPYLDLKELDEIIKG